MKLNPDCVRDILLAIESLPDVNHFFLFDVVSISERFPCYSPEEIMYHLRQCELNDFLFRPSHDSHYNTYTVYDLTPKGHQFLANIRENKIWNGVKAIAGKVGSTSLDSLVQIASNVISELIKSQFGIIS